MDNIKIPEGMDQELLGGPGQEDEPEEEGEDVIKSREKQFSCVSCKSSNLRILTVQDFPDRFILKCACQNLSCGVLNVFTLPKDNGVQKTSSPNYWG